MRTLWFLYEEPPLGASSRPNTALSSGMTKTMFHVILPEEKSNISNSSLSWSHRVAVKEITWRVSCLEFPQEIRTQNYFT